MKKWSQFNKNTQHNPPRDLYLEAVKLIDANNAEALDIAAGALNETKDMLARGFKVTAIDSNTDITALASEINDKNLSVFVSTMQDFEYEVNKYDLVIAMFALPFIDPADFNRTFNKIVKSVKKGGIFAFHLFGVDDEWSNNPKMTFHDKESASKLVDRLEVLRLKELKDVKKIANGTKKNWHVFQVIAKCN